MGMQVLSEMGQSKLVAFDQIDKVSWHHCASLRQRNISRGSLLW